MAQQQFMLKWNNHLSNLSEVFNNMLVSENLVDVTIACEGASLKAHKMILSACSPFFQSLFMTNPCKHPIVILKDVRFIDLKAIIDFMYSGEVNVSQDQLTSLLKAAETLKVKGLAEVTEKQARNQQPITNSSIYHQNRPKRRHRHGNICKTKDSSCQTSESEEEGGTVKRFHASRLGTQREKERQLLQQQRNNQQLEIQVNSQSQQQQQSQQREHEITTENQAPPTEAQELEGEAKIIGVEVDAATQEQLAAAESIQQMDPSRILEQSIATASVVLSEDAANLIVASDVHDVAETAIKQVSLYEEGIQITPEDSGQFSLSTTQTITTTSTSSTVSHQGRRLMMSDAHKTCLKDFLDKPISQFDVIIDDWKKSIVWQYFGGLVYKNPENGTVSVVDNERHYCLKCIIDCQERNPDEIFERCNICFLSTGTATGNHKNHLRHRHAVLDESVTTSSTPTGSSSKSSGIRQSSSKAARKRSTKVISISLDNYT